MKVLSELPTAFRRLAKTPGFAATAVLALALGIGVNSTVFSLLDAALLRPLPFRDPGRLVVVWDQFPELGLPKFTLAEPEILDLRQSGVFTGVAPYQFPFEVNLSGGGQPVRLTGARVGAGLFELLGAQAAEGRVFHPEEGKPGNDGVVVLSHAFWRERFGGDPGAVGQSVQLDGRPYTIIGVLPPDVRFPGEAQVFLPMEIDPARLSDRGNHYLNAVARLRPDLSPEQVKARTATLAARLQKDEPQFYPANSGWSIGLVPIREEMSGAIRPALLLLMAATALILLLTCANVAHLLLIRAESRQTEVAVRVAFGAGPRDVGRQFLGESLVLCLLGGALGLAAVPPALRLIRLWNPDSLPALAGASLDLRVLAFTLGVSLVTALSFGRIPVRLARLNPARLLAGGVGRATGDRRRRLVRDLLIVTEVAVSFLLLSGAALLLRSFWNLQRVEPGFREAGVLTLKIAPTPASYPTAAQLKGLYTRLQESLQAIPGVEQVGWVSGLPMADSNYDWSFTIEGRPVPDGEPGPTADYQVVSPEYFRILGIPVVRGHAFTVRDDERSVPVVVVNETLARRYWPDGDPVGKRIRLNGPETNPWATIVGVVGDVRQQGLDSEPRAETFFPFNQFPEVSDNTLVHTQTLVLQAREGVETGALAGAAERAVWSVDPNIPVARIESLDRIVEASAGTRRLSLRLFLVMAVLTLFLAGLGTYGVVSYLVAGRTREIGIRMALGVSRGSLWRLILRQGLAPVLIGLVLGLVATLASGRFVAGLLFGISAADPVSLLGVGAVLLLIALAAISIPARRAVGLEPVLALRTE